MALPLGHEDIKKLKTFIDFCSSNPTVLNFPQLLFLKDFIEKLGGKVPEGIFSMPSGQEGKCPFAGDMPKKQSSPKVEEVEMESDTPESDLEIDMDGNGLRREAAAAFTEQNFEKAIELYPGVIADNDDVNQPMGDDTKTPTEEEILEANELRSKAAAAFTEQDFEKAIDYYTKAIELNPGNALFHAKRGQAFLKLVKPSACIRDCNKALEINCDSAAAYKFRGRAHRLLGNWEFAAKDLRQACKLDFDEEADEWLREVTPKAKKIEQHQIKQERKRAEKELQKRQERLRRAQEANKKAREDNTKTTGTSESFDGTGANINFQDILSSFQDPEVAAALQDIATNPANIEKYKLNPKISKLIDVVKGMGGAGGGFPGGFPGFGGSGGFPFPSAGNGNTANTDPPPTTQASEQKDVPKKDFVDDGLD